LPDDLEDPAMSDPDIGALRAKIASRPRPADYRLRRKDIDDRGLAYGTAADVSVEKVDADGVAAEWTATPGAARDAAILYVHGGGYVIGSLDSHRHMVAELGRAANCVALALDY
jgi:acetyl esterase/lipase